MSTLVAQRPVTPPPFSSTLCHCRCAAPPPPPPAAAALWAAQRQWLQHTLARAALGLGLLAAVATAAANAWGVPAINRQLLPQVQATAAVLLQREVQLGAVGWVAPVTGLVGLTPLASLGPISLGPGPVERSSARVGRVSVGLDPLQSALQRRVVLTIRALGAEVGGWLVWVRGCPNGCVC